MAMRACRRDTAPDVRRITPGPSRPSTFSPAVNAISSFLPISQPLGSSAVAPDDVGASAWNAYPKPCNVRSNRGSRRWSAIASRISETSDGRLLSETNVPGQSRS
jgi:hypothetical protein